MDAAAPLELDIRPDGRDDVFDKGLLLLRSLFLNAPPGHEARDAHLWLHEQAGPGVVVRHGSVPKGALEEHLRNMGEREQALHSIELARDEHPGVVVEVGPAFAPALVPPPRLPADRVPQRFARAIRRDCAATKSACR